MFECRIEKDSHPDATVLRIRGEIDQRTSDAFGEHLAAIAADGHHLIVDLSEVDYFDASGLRFLDIVQQRCRAQGRLLLLVSPSIEDLSPRLTSAPIHQSFTMLQEIFL